MLSLLWPIAMIATIQKLQWFGCLHRTNLGNMPGRRSHKNHWSCSGSDWFAQGRSDLQVSLGFVNIQKSPKKLTKYAVYSAVYILHFSTYNIATYGHHGYKFIPLIIIIIYSFRAKSILQKRWQWLTQCLGIMLWNKLSKVIVAKSYMISTTSTQPTLLSWDAWSQKQTHSCLQ